MGKTKFAGINGQAYSRKRRHRFNASGCKTYGVNLTSSSFDKTLV
jgi:hypothetical protein